MRNTSRNLKKKHLSKLKRRVKKETKGKGPNYQKVASSASDMADETEATNEAVNEEEQKKKKQKNPIELIQSKRRNLLLTVSVLRILIGIYLFANIICHVIFKYFGHWVTPTRAEMPKLTTNPDEPDFMNTPAMHRYRRSMTLISFIDILFYNVPLSIIINGAILAVVSYSFVVLINHYGDDDEFIFADEENEKEEEEKTDKKTDDPEAKRPKPTQRLLVEAKIDSSYQILFILTNGYLLGLVVFAYYYIVEDIGEPNYSWMQVLTHRKLLWISAKVFGIAVLFYYEFRMVQSMKSLKVQYEELSAKLFEAYDKMDFNRDDWLKAEMEVNDENLEDLDKEE